MIVGARYWDDRERYYSQVNNPTEEQLRKHGTGSWLETCGATAAVTCLAALGYNLEVICPGAYRPQPEEVLADYLNDPRVYGELLKVRPDWDPKAAPGNRVANYYPYAVMAVFRAQAEYIPAINREGVIGHLLRCHAVQVCLKPPGHYVAAVAYDKATEEIIYHDPWPGRKPSWGGDGFGRRMTKTEEAAIQRYVVAYLPPIG